MYPLGQLIHLKAVLMININAGRMEDIYDVSDNENENPGENNGPPGGDEGVGVEAGADDEPFMILAHTDTREYVAHMHARDALPDNNDDIFDNLPETNQGKDMSHLKFKSIS